MRGIKYKSSVVRFLTFIYKNNRLKILVSFVLVIMVSMVDLVFPQLTRKIVDNAIGEHNINLLVKLVILYGILSIASVFIDIVLDYFYSKMKNKSALDLEISMLKHISKLSGKYYSNIKTGNLLSILDNDMFIIENFGADIIFSIIIDFSTALIALFFLIRLQFDLFLIVIVLQLILVVLQSKLTNIIADKTAEVRTDYGRIANIVQEYVSNIMNVVLARSKRKFFKSFLHKERKIIKKFIRLDMVISGNIAIARFVSTLITIAIYGFGGYKIIKGKMTLGELIAFREYTGMLIGPCINIIRSNTRIQQAKVSLDRIYSVIDEEICIKVDNKGLRLNNTDVDSIIFKNVSFSYNSNEEKILKNINLKFKRGKTTALVGGSGCGKSTIVNLIYRLWDLDDGHIYINDTDIRDLNLLSLRKNICVLSQDLFLLDDTIRNNIVLDNKISDEKLKNICELTGLSELIDSLKLGLDTVIGERGVKLSGGQKQRLAIARALLSECPIIIFDEATSALDNISQKSIIRNIKEIVEDRIMIVIAHRLSTIDDADLIYVLEDGKVVEQGNKDELVDLKGKYFQYLSEAES